MNVREEFRRPMSLGLASLVLIGWILAVSIWALYSSRLGKLQRQLGEARVQTSDLSRELQAERNAAGTLADLETKVAASRQLLLTTIRARDNARADVVELQRQTAEVRLQIGAERGNLADLRGREELAKTATALAETGLDRTRTQLKQEQEQSGTLAASIESAKSEQEARIRALAALEEQLGREKARLETLVGDGRRLETKLDQQRSELSALTERLTKSQAALDAVTRQSGSDRTQPPNSGTAAPGRAPESRDPGHASSSSDLTHSDNALPPPKFSGPAPEPPRPSGSPDAAGPARTEGAAPKGLAAPKNKP